MANSAGDWGKSRPAGRARADSGDDAAAATPRRPSARWCTTTRWPSAGSAPAGRSGPARSPSATANRRTHGAKRCSACAMTLLPRHRNLLRRDRRRGLHRRAAHPLQRRRLADRPARPLRRRRARGRRPRHLQRLLPVIDEALRQADVTLADVGCVAVHNTPGLVGALLVGVTRREDVVAGAGRAADRRQPRPRPRLRLPAGGRARHLPCVGLVVSGGHTLLFHCPDAAVVQHRSAARSTMRPARRSTRWRPARAGLSRRAGRRARGGRSATPTAFRFPRSFLHDDRLDFSFSGLKTAVLYAAWRAEQRPRRAAAAGQVRADLAASFQQAVVDVLVGKARQALRRTGLNAAGRRRRRGGQPAVPRGAGGACADDEGVELFIPPLSLCTDNAAMAAMAVESVPPWPVCRARPRCRTRARVLRNRKRRAEGEALRVE